MRQGCIVQVTLPRQVLLARAPYIYRYALLHKSPSVACVHRRQILRDKSRWTQNVANSSKEGCNTQQGTPVCTVLWVHYLFFLPPEYCLATSPILGVVKCGRTWSTLDVHVTTQCAYVDLEQQECDKLGSTIGIHITHPHTFPCAWAVLINNVGLTHAHPNVNNYNSFVTNTRPAHIMQE